MLRDFRYAARQLLESKGWTVVILLSLALGIGANTTLFSAANAFLLSTIPVEDPPTLVRLRTVGNNDRARSSSDYGYSEGTVDGESVRATFSYPAYQDLRAANRTLAGIAAAAPTRVNAGFGGRREPASATLVSGNFFDVVGVSAALGRTFVADDDLRSADPVVMISHAYWERRFGKDPGVIGRPLTINGAPTTIVGVLDPGFTGIQRLGETVADVHIPLSLDPLFQDGNDRLAEGTTWWLQLVGRMPRGVTADEVRANLDGVFQESARRGLDDFLATASDDDRIRLADRTAVPRLHVSSAARGIYDPQPNTRRGIRVLGAVVILILLIVCANVANLLLSRAAKRQKEIGVRLSVGATRIRLIRQLLTESLLLSGAGGVLGLIVAYGSRQLLPFAENVPIDWNVFLFAAGLSVLTGIVFGLVPAFRATSVDLATSLKDTSRSVVGSRMRLSRALLVGQVAIALVLVVGSGLLLSTLRNLRSVEVGFDPGNLLLFQVQPGLMGYEGDDRNRLYQRMEDELRAIPRVRSVSFSQTALLSGAQWISGFRVPGRGDQTHRVSMMTVSPGFLETMDIPILAGRGFSISDTADAPGVVMLNAAAAAEYFPGQNALGQRLGFSPTQNANLEVIGILGDTKYASVREAAPPTMYRPHTQTPLSTATFELRTEGAPGLLIPAVRAAVEGIDAELALTEVSTQVEQVEERFSEERLFALAYSLFGGLALLLASIGLFGLMAYSVEHRTNEIGIRVALGAERMDVARSVVTGYAFLIGLGVAIGLGGSWAAVRLIESLLYDVAPTDPAIMILAVVVVLAVSAMAMVLPLRRALRVNPTVALRYE